MGETLLVARPKIECQLPDREAPLIKTTPSFGEGESGSGTTPEPLSLAGASLKTLDGPGKFLGCSLSEAAQLPLRQGLLLSHFPAWETEAQREALVQGQHAGLLGVSCFIPCLKAASGREGVWVRVQLTAGAWASGGSFLPGASFSPR